MHLASRAEPQLPRPAEACDQVDPDPMQVGRCRHSSEVPPFPVTEHPVSISLLGFRGSQLHSTSKSLPVGDKVSNDLFTHVPMPLLISLDENGQGSEQTVPISSDTNAFIPCVFYTLLSSGLLRASQVRLVIMAASRITSGVLAPPPCSIRRTARTHASALNGLG